MSDNASVHKDFFNLATKDRIGYGMSREVWSSDLFPDCVIKVEDKTGKFQNIVEWETWNRVKGTEFEKWFAPCRWISPNGIVLIMEKTAPLCKYPEKMPVFLGDFKRTNYGSYKGHIVCHDYGTNLLFEYGMSKRLRKVNWWDE